MNVERITRLRDHIANLPDEQFDMGTFCGTARCIGGWAVALFATRNDLIDHDGHKLKPHPSTPIEVMLDTATIDYERTTAELLGLDYDTTRDLCLGHFSPFDLKNLSREQAVATIDALLETGKPAWPEEYTDR